MKKHNNPLISDDSVNVILEIAYAYQKSKILLTACELDIFTVLSSSPKTAAEVAELIQADEKATERLLNALSALQFTKKKSNSFSNTDGTDRFLVHGKDEFLGNLDYISRLWDTWGNLTEAVKNGKPSQFKNLADKSSGWIKSYVESLHWRAVLKAPDIINLIDLNGANRVLDLGCGSGLYAMHFVKSKPDMKAVAYDLPIVIEETKKHIDMVNLSSRIETKGGNCLTDDIGDNYDIVFISGLIQYFSIWENIDLIKKVFSALKPGGKLVIQDYIIDSDRTGPLKAVLNSIDMLVNTEAGNSFARTDYWIAMKEAGFATVEKLETPFDTDLMIGYKDSL